MKFSIKSAAIATLILFSGCETTPKVPAIVTWTVTVNSTPEGADISWKSDGQMHSVGKAPVTVTIPMMATQQGNYPAVFLYAKIGNSETNVCGIKDAWYYWELSQIGTLPKGVTIDLYKPNRFSDFSGKYYLRDYEKNPQMWSQYVTAFEGEVQSIKESPDGCVVVLYLKDAQRSVVVGWAKQTMRGVYEGTFLKVLGNIVGTTEGVNGYGAPMTVLTFAAYGYSANWLYQDLMPERVVNDFMSDKKALFDKWADGSLFVDNKGVIPVAP